MAIVVDPNQFRVPYAIGGDDLLYQIADGRPKCENLFCPICRTPVAFVREIEARAAHFRHHSRSDCDALAAYHRQTLHDTVRDAALALLNTGTQTSRICHSNLPLPTGRASSEDTQTVKGRKHRPDIVVRPRENEAAPLLELEVVYSHRPEPDRVARAAADGRIIGVIDIAPIERDYYRKLWAGEAFDTPEACKAYVLDRRFTVLENADVRRTVRGLLDGKRQYLKARIRQQDAARTAGAETRHTWTGRLVSHVA